ncbi:MAG TPA: hypothetical protein VEY50_09615 [Lysobacter sp.]|nr:hypothetical protein [Lysobacter sp.]
MRPSSVLSCTALALSLLLTACGDDSPALASTTPAPPPAATAAPAPAPEPALQPPPFDPALESYERAQLPKAVAELGGIDRAMWASDSTLVVYVGDGAFATRDYLCPIVERYPALRTTRLQLQMPAGSGAPVRFLQCKQF